MTIEREQPVTTMLDVKSFPHDFLWGTSTSAYQIEGAVSEDGRGRSIWDDFADTPGKTHAGETGAHAADHYYRMPEDVALMQQLGLNSYCFSIAWPRIMPDGRGAVNYKGLDFYDRLVDTLLMQGITPIAKLYHWDLPAALQQQGGWLQRDTALAFVDYTEVVARRLGDRVACWITQNEPWCISYLGYGIGVHAPGVQDTQAAVIAAHHVLLSHGLAVPCLRTHIKQSARVGITLDLYPIHAADDRPETLQAVQRADRFRNRWFLDPIFRGAYPEELFSDLAVSPPPMEADDLAHISTPIDFLGVNYYSRWLVRGQTQNPVPQNFEQVTAIPGASYTQMGWEIYPTGLLEVLERVNREYAPPMMIITENGAAFPDALNGDNSVADPQRTQYLYEHIQAVGQALAQGIPVGGYFAWSLLDNYEWAEGYSKRFGLVYVDFSTQRRIVKDSGHGYAAFLTSM